MSSPSAAKPQSARGGSGFRWNPGESYLCAASFKAIVGKTRMDATEAAIRAQSLGKQAQMGPDWIPPGLVARKIAEVDFEKRGGNIQRGKLERPMTVPTPPNATGRSFGATPRTGEQMLLSQRLREELAATPRSAAAPQAQVGSVDPLQVQESEAIGRKPRLQQDSIQPEWWPGEPIPHLHASSFSMQAPVPRRPTTSAGAASLGASQALEAAAVSSTPAGSGAGASPRVLAVTPRTKTAVYPFHWRPTETSLVRDSFNAMIRKEACDVTDMMQSHASMGRKAQLEGLGESA